MYFNIVCTDLMIKGLVRDFVSFQKEKVFINLKKTKPKQRLCCCANETYQIWEVYLT